MNMSFNMVAPMVRSEPVTAEEGYRASVRAFSPSFELLAISGDGHVRALALVGGLMVECLLKVFLSRNGKTQKELGHLPLGHDLEALWTQAYADGLSIEATAPDWCVKLNCLHFGNKDPDNTGQTTDVPLARRFPLRYQSGMNGLAFPVTCEMVEGVRALSNSVGTNLAC